MQQLKRILMLATIMQASMFALGAGAEQQRIDDSSIQPREHRQWVHHSGESQGNYASFFLTTASSVDGVNTGDNVLFNNQVALSGIEYDSETGVFTLRPGTYAITYFFAPFTIPSVNMYVNGQLILNSPLGGSSTVLTLTEHTNTLTLNYISSGTFSAPSPGQSWVSIAISQID